MKSNRRLIAAMEAAGPIRMRARAWMRARAKGLQNGAKKTPLKIMGCD
jgi:hypothetical protein